MQYKSETMNKNKQYTENLNTKELILFCKFER